jgi:hypothetical protein
MPDREQQPQPRSAEWWQQWIWIQRGRVEAYYWTAQIDAMMTAATRLGPVVERYGG